ncbi:MAG TPA: ATP-binding cassette domain-containing protein, partial [Arcobacter sp.]|nr:ATP-binding cassette domain-containing protein [Arcobacter sp.]
FHDEYDENGKLKDNCKLTIDKNDNYISDFFGENISVTAIVGKNGSGKSTLLNSIINSVEEGFPIETKYFIIFNYDGSEVYNSNFPINTTLSESIEKLHIITSVKRGNNDGVTFVINKNQSNNEKLHNKVKNYKNINLEEEMIFRLLAIEVASLNPNFKLSTFMYLPEKISFILKDKEDIINNQIIIFMDIKQREEVKKVLIQIDNSYHLFLAIEYIKRTFGNVNIESLENIHKLKHEIKVQNWKILSWKDFDKYFVQKNIFYIHNLDQTIKNILRVNGYLHQVNVDLIDNKGRKFDDLSHGEQSIFAQLLNIYFYMKDHAQVFLFDEPEISLHPNWQKKYLNEVFKLLEKSTEINHFIVASHSPFLLSDIPKQNIIFLDKDENGNCKVLTHDEVLEKKQTFGANIHTLLSDSFFMEDGLMGEFAKGKINEIKNLYQLIKDENVQKRLEEEKIKELAQKAFHRRKKRLWQIQKIIGEPFLQKVIKNYLDDLEILFSDDKTLIDKELAEIEERRVYLESLKK